VEEWIGWILALLLGALAAWLAFRYRRNVTSYRRRMAQHRDNWETVEERLADALKRVSHLEAGLDAKERELDRIQAGVDELLREKEELSRKKPGEGD
jgi:septal ring factor EnvC (AmiA/AmiB activator)